MASSLKKGKIFFTQKNSRTKKMSAFVEVEGKQGWYPKSVIKDNEDGTVSIENWWLEKK